MEYGDITDLVLLAVYNRVLSFKGYKDVTSHINFIFCTCRDYCECSQGNVMDALTSLYSVVVINHTKKIIVISTR